MMSVLRWGFSIMHSFDECPALDRLKHPATSNCKLKNTYLDPMPMMCVSTVVFMILKLQLTTSVIYKQWKAGLLVLSELAFPVSRLLNSLHMDFLYPQVGDVSACRIAKASDQAVTVLLRTWTGDRDTERSEAEWNAVDRSLFPRRGWGNNSFSSSSLFVSCMVPLGGGFHGRPIKTMDSVSRPGLCLLQDTITDMVITM